MYIIDDAMQCTLWASGWPGVAQSWAPMHAQTDCMPDWWWLPKCFMSVSHTLVHKYSGTSVPGDGWQSWQWGDAEGIK